MNITIRQATINDADIIIRFQQKMAMETEGISLDDNTIDCGVKSVFENPSRGRYYVAEAGGKLVASLMITTEWSDWRNSDIWWFQSVYVIPEARRKGIFRAMYEFIKARAISEGIPGLRLYVEKENRRAQDTYTKLGMDGVHYQMFEWMK